MNKYILTIDFGLHFEVTVVDSTLRELYDYTSRLVRTARRGHRKARVFARDYETGICVLHAYATQSARDGAWIAEVW